MKTIRFTLATLVIFLCTLILWQQNANAQSGTLLYGVTAQGGTGDGTGTIFHVDPATGVMTTDYSFTNGGYGPTCVLAYYNGRFYGVTTSWGGYPGNYGFIFEWNPADNTFTHKYDFDYYAIGLPWGNSLTLYGDKFYGTTFEGGPGGQGVLYEWDPATNNITVKHVFNSPTGVSPWGNNLALYNGKLYGMTISGGNDYGAVIFEYDPVSNLYTKKIDFSSTGYGPVMGNSLTLYAGKFYAILGGVIIEWDPVSNLIVYRITDGHYCEGSMTRFGNKFYFQAEGLENNSSGEAIFSWDPVTNIVNPEYIFEPSYSGSVVHLNSLTVYGGKLYGMTNSGGMFNKGVLFTWDPVVHSFNKLLDFNGPNGAGPLYTQLSPNSYPCNLTAEAGPDATTYFGIASMQQVTRTVEVSGGTAPFTYTWTMNRPLLCNQQNAEGDELFYGGTCTNNTCPSSGSPSGIATCSESATINAILMDTATVCVTVTDANGCTATDCFTVMASDVRVVGQCGYALEFEASNVSYVESYPITDVSNNFTMEFWVKPNKLIKTGMVETVAINNDYTGTSGQNYAVSPDWYYPPEPLDPVIWTPTGIYNIGGHAGAGVSVGTNGIAIFECSAWHMPAILVWYAPISSSVWTHIAVVYTNQTPALYINGSWVHTGATSLKSFVHPSAWLGHDWNYGPFSGTIDEFRIWDVDLSAGTISSWFDQPVTPSHPDYIHLYTYLKLNEGSGTIASDASGNGHDGTLVNSPAWISGWWPEGATPPTVEAGPDATTYFGIASMQQVTRTVEVSGGTVPFTYTWTMDRPLLCNQVNAGGDELFYGGTCTNNTCPSSGSPSGIASCSESATINAILMDTATVCVTVTDANGCTATDCFTVMASDVRCYSGNGGNQKTKMCHHTNSNSNPWVEICVDNNAVNAHLAHGDYIGSCISGNNAPITGTDPDPDIHIYPNPADDILTIRLHAGEGDNLKIQISNIHGQVLYSAEKAGIDGENTYQVDLNNFSNGIYLVLVRNGNSVNVSRVVVLH